jgi:hypothetical protein
LIYVKGSEAGIGEKPVREGGFPPFFENIKHKKAGAFA